MLVSIDPRESYIGVEEHVVGDDNVSTLFDTSPKVDEQISSFVRPSNKNKEIDENELPLRWFIYNKEVVRLRRK